MKKFQFMLVLAAIVALGWSIYSGAYMAGIDHATKWLIHGYRGLAVGIVSLSLAVVCYKLPVRAYNPYRSSDNLDFVLRLGAASLPFVSAFSFISFVIGRTLLHR